MIFINVFLNELHNQQTKIESPALELFVLFYLYDNNFQPDKKKKQLIYSKSMCVLTEALQDEGSLLQPAATGVQIGR